MGYSPPNVSIGRLADFDGRIHPPLLLVYPTALHPRQSEGCFVSLIGDLPTDAEQWWRRSINQQRPPLKHTSPVPQVCPNRSKFQLSWSRAMHDKWCRSIVTLPVRQVATRGADLNLRGSIEVAIGHRPDRIDAGRTGYRSVHAFPERFRLRPRQVEAVPSLFSSQYRMGAGGSTRFTWPVQLEHPTGGDPRRLLHYLPQASNNSDHFVAPIQVAIQSQQVASARHSFYLGCTGRASDRWRSPAASTLFTGAFQHCTNLHGANPSSDLVVHPEP